MKRYENLWSGLFLFLMILGCVSCAEEGPFKVGDYDFIIDGIQTLTPKAAIITATVPDESENLLNGSIGLRLKGRNYFKEDASAGDRHLFYELEPGGEYEIGFYTKNIRDDVGADTGGKWFSTGYTFILPQAGDYSELGETITCEAVELVELNKPYTIISVNLPGNLYPQYLSVYPPKLSLGLYASKLSDMRDVVEGKFLNQEDNRYTFQFDNLKEGEYYLQLRGDFEFKPDGFSKTINIRESSINILQPINITSKISGDFTCEVVESNELYTIIRVNLPANLYINEDYEVYLWSIIKGEEIRLKLCKNQDGNYFFVHSSSGSLDDGLYDVMEEGVYNFMISGHWKYRPDGSSTSIDLGWRSFNISNSVNIKHGKLNMGEVNCKVIETNKSYTKIKVNLPSNITPIDNYGYDLYIGTSTKGFYDRGEISVNDKNIFIFNNLEDGVYYFAPFGSWRYTLEEYSYTSTINWSFLTISNSVIISNSNK